MGRTSIRSNDDILEAHQELVKKVCSSFSWDQLKWSDRYTEYKSRENFSKLIKKDDKGKFSKQLTSECYVWDVFKRLKDAICGKSDVPMSQITQEQGDNLYKQLKLLSGLITSSRYYTDGKFEESVRKHCRWFGKYKKENVKVKVSKEIAEKLAHFGVIRADDKIAKSVENPVEKNEKKSVEGAEMKKDGNPLPPVGTRLWMLDNGRVVRCEIVSPRVFDEKTTIKRAILVLDGKYEGAWSPSPGAIVDLILSKNYHNGWNRIRYQLNGSTEGNSKKAKEVMSRGFINRAMYVNNRATTERDPLLRPYSIPNDDEKIPSVKEVFGLPTLAMWKASNYVKTERKPKDGSGGQLTVTVNGKVLAGPAKGGTVIGYVTSVFEAQGSTSFDEQLKKKMQELWTAYNEHRITRSDLNLGLDELEGLSHKVAAMDSLRKEIQDKHNELRDLSQELAGLGFTV